MKVRRVKPVKHEETVGFVDYTDNGGIECFKVPVYPPSPAGREFRRRRVAAGVSIGEAARRLGVSALTVSQLERGAATVDDWEAVYAALTDKGL